MIEYTRMSSSIGLDDAYCQKVIDTAVEVLHNTGITSKSQRVKRYLGEFPGVEVHGDAVRFDREMMHAHVHEIGRQQRPLPPKTLGHGQPWCCLNLADASTGRIRPADESDLIKIVRFMDAFDAPGNVPPVALQEYPANIRDLHGTRVCLEHSAVYGAPTHTPSPTELPFYREMADIAGRKIWMLGMLINNPMRFDDMVLEFVIDNRDSAQLSIEMVGGLPAIGSTSPMSFPAAHVQGLAEDLAAAFFMHTIEGGYPPPYLRGDPFDMRYANYRIAGSEYILLDMANRRLHEYITGGPRDWGYLLSMAKWPDQQAAFERTISCWNQAMNGATFFKGSGQLSSDEVFSLEQVVIDRDIVRSAQRVATGLKFDRDFSDVEKTIAEGMEAGNYLIHDSTLSEFREFFYDSVLFTGTNLGQWRTSGEKDVLSRAQEVVVKTLEQSTYSMDQDSRRALMGVCKRAEEVLL